MKEIRLRPTDLNKYFIELGETATVNYEIITKVFERLHYSSVILLDRKRNPVSRLYFRDGYNNKFHI